MRILNHKLYTRVSTFALAFVVAVSSLTGIGQFLFTETASAAPVIETVYDALPSVSPATNYSSYGFQATSMAELGDSVKLGGVNRVLDTVTVTMSDWAKFSDYSSDPLYSGNSATWSHDITLNVYDANAIGANGAPTNKIATKTQSVAIPWRPEVPTYTYNGIAFNVDFDLSDQATVLPEDVIVSVEFDTQSRGYTPTGVPGPYNSLNVAAPANQAQTIGQDNDTNAAYVYTTNLPYYTDGLPYSSFRNDTGWAPNGTLGVRLTATPVDPTAPVIDVKGKGNTYAPLSVGSTTYDAYRTANFKLFDNAGLNGWNVNNKAWHAATTNYSDANDIVIGSGVYQGQYGPNTLNVRDTSDNVSTYNFVLDNIAPTITPNAADSIGSVSGNVFSKVNFNLYDEYQINQWWVNTTASLHTQSADEYSNANDISVGQNGGIVGLNTLYVTDQAGNVASFDFYLNNVGPSITVKGKGNTDTPLSVGHFLSDTYRTVNFKLYDATKVAKFQVNTGAIVPVTPNSYSDANGITVGQKGGVQGANTIRVWDIAGNYTDFAFTLDTLAPVPTISYSPATATNGSVTATLDFDEALDATSLSGWTKVTDTQYTKVFTANGSEVATFRDIAGNQASTPVAVTWIDSAAPTAAFTFSNNNGNAVTKDDVTVTMTTNEAIQTPADWTQTDTDGKVFTRVYSTNGFKFVTITDLVGNSVVKSFEVKRIDKVNPTVTGIENFNTYAPTAAFSVYDQNLSAVYVDSVKVFTAGPQNFASVVSGNGIHTVRAIDKAGNETLVTFLIDTAAPTGTFQYSNNNGNAVTKEDVTVTLTTNEPIETPADWTQTDTDGKVFTRVYSENGKYTVLATDLYGNSATLKFEVKRIDRIFPVFGDVTDLGVYNTASKTFTVTEQSLSKIYDGTTALSYMTAGHVHTATVTGEGVHTLKAVDKAGNETTIVITIDSLSPETPEFTAPTALYSTSSSVTLEWTDVAATDEGTAVSYRLIVSQSSEQDADLKLANPIGDPNESNTNSFTVNNNDDGTYYWQVQAVDAAGNVSSWSQVKEVIVDTQAPVVAFVTEASTVGNDATVTIQATLDGLEETAGYTLTLNGTPVASVRNGTNVTYSFDTTDLASGDYDFVLKSADLANNQSNIAELTITVDNTAPVVTTVPYNGIDTTPTITGTVDDATAIVTVDGNEATVATTANLDDTYTWTYTFPTQSVGGPRIYTVLATDEYGNESDEVEGSVTIIAGTTVPEPTAAAIDTTAGTPPAAGAQQTAGGTVLGDQTDEATQNNVVADGTTGDEDVKAATDDKTQSSGFAWYWWLIIIAILTAIGIGIRQYSLRNKAE